MRDGGEDTLSAEVIQSALPLLPALPGGFAVQAGRGLSS